MDLINFLRKIDSKMQVSTREEFRTDVPLQKKYLYKLPEPKDNIERSYFQYLCQRYNKVQKTKIIEAVGSGLVYPIIKVVLSLCRSAKSKRAASAVFLPDGKTLDVVPEQLKKEFQEIEIENNRHYALTKADCLYLKTIEKRYKKDKSFLLKAMVKIARYSYLIRKWRPKALIVCNEYSFTSSIMTEYCNRNNVELINVMHGEKLFSLKDSFFRFNKCFVWNEYYIGLFKKLRSKCDEYVIALPDSMIILNDENDKSVDYTFYLQDESPEVLRSVVSIMEKIQGAGNTVSIRPHPRYTDIKMLNNITVLPVEGKEVSIEESLRRTRHAISFCSTVLNQAYFNKIPIIIDDITRPDEYEKLMQMEYIMLNVKHELLSNII